MGLGYWVGGSGGDATRIPILWAAPTYQFRSIGDFVLYVVVMLVLVALFLAVFALIITGVNRWEERRQQRAIQAFWDEHSYSSASGSGGIVEISATISQTTSRSPWNPAASPERHPSLQRRRPEGCYVFSPTAFIENTRNLTFLDGDQVADLAAETLGEIHVKLELEWLRYFPAEARQFLESVDRLLERTWTDHPAAAGDPRLQGKYENEAAGLRSLVFANFPKVLGQILPHMKKKVAEGVEDPGEWRTLAEAYERLIADPSLFTSYDPERLSPGSGAGVDQANDVKSFNAREVPDLESMIGQPMVKAVIERLEATAMLVAERRELGLPPILFSFHCVFAGNPGTGKTSFARILAARLKKAGLVSQGHLVEVTRADLVAGYLGQTAIRTREKVLSAKGGILFIDEAYALKNGDNDSYGQECIDTLLKLIEDLRDDLVVVIAGYTEPIRTFLGTNPGLASRFPNWVEFTDYEEEELGEIFDGLVHRSGMICPREARAAALALVRSAPRGLHFGNAREVRSCFERGVQNLGLRLATLGRRPTKDELCEFRVEDFQ